MLKLFLYAITFFATMLIFSCLSHQKDCFLTYSPTIHYVGFDSADISQIYVEQYKKCCGFDSLIQKDTLNYTGSFPTSNEDTIYISGLYFPSGANSYANPNFNWIIKLSNNAQIRLSNILFEKNTCEAGHLTTTCFCNLKSFEIETVNCTYKTVKKTSTSSIYIHK